MVAITVVLAAVLYVMVMGFGSGGSNDTPTGSLTWEKTATNTYRVSIASISDSDVLRSDVELYNNGTEITAVTWVPAAGQYVTAGSYFTIVVSANSVNSINLLYTPSGNNIATLTINNA
jgi:FlaG/FlaF family flagellin (archaellin)